MYHIRPYFPVFQIEPAKVLYHLPSYHSTSADLINFQPCNTHVNEANNLQTTEGQPSRMVDNELALQLFKLSSRLDTLINVLSKEQKKIEKKANGEITKSATKPKDKKSQKEVERCNNLTRNEKLQSNSPNFVHAGLGPTSCAIFPIHDYGDDFRKKYFGQILQCHLPPSGIALIDIFKKIGGKRNICFASNTSSIAAQSGRVLVTLYLGADEPCIIQQDQTKIKGENVVWKFLGSLLGLYCEDDHPINAITEQWLGLPSSVQIDELSRRMSAYLGTYDFLSSKHAICLSDLMLRCCFVNTNTHGLLQWTDVKTASNVQLWIKRVDEIPKNTKLLSKRRKVVALLSMLFNHFKLFQKYLLSAFDLNSHMAELGTQQSADNGPEMVEMEPQGSSRSTGDQKTHDETISKLDKLLAEGHKMMLSQSFEQASAVLCEAVELASDFFGDFSPQSFMPLFKYGKALIEVARLESLPIKPLTSDIDESDTEDEDDQIEEEEQNDHVIDKEDNESTDARNDQQQKTVEEKQQNGEDKLLEDNEEDGNEDDTQIAWENLEVARKICENQMKDSRMDLWMERKADVLVALGECMTVSENFPCALEEFMKALTIRKELFGESDRRTAEVYFWIGRTHKLMDDFKAAAEHFENAKKVLETLVVAKEKELEQKGKESCVSLCQELEELRDALKGVDENVKDAVDSIEEQIKREKAMKTMLQPFLMQALNAKEVNEEANDITGMLKRKTVKRPLVMSETVTDVQHEAKMSKMETNNGNSGEQQMNDCGDNGN